MPGSIIIDEFHHTKSVEPPPFNAKQDKPSSPRFWDLYFRHDKYVYIKESYVSNRNNILYTRVVCEFGHDHPYIRKAKADQIRVDIVRTNTKDQDIKDKQLLSQRAAHRLELRNRKERMTRSRSLWQRQNPWVRSTKTQKGVRLSRASANFRRRRYHQVPQHYHWQVETEAHRQACDQQRNSH